MITRDELQNYLNQLLRVDEFSDYAPNGLQVAGKSEVKVIVSGVTACQELLDRAIELNADAVLVHHGYFWKNENPCVVGMKRERLKTLLQHDINLFGYHLPLDAHEEFGNNAQLGKVLEIEGCAAVGDVGDARIIFKGELNKPVAANDFSEIIARQLQRAPLLIEGGDFAIKKLAWCTGGAQDFIEVASELGVDAFVTGEVSERTTHAARELGIHFYAAGHHATERYGVQALGAHLEDKFGVKHIFVDVDNPV